MTEDERQQGAEFAEQLSQLPNAFDGALWTRTIQTLSRTPCERCEPGSPLEDAIAANVAIMAFALARAFGPRAYRGEALQG